MYCDLEGYFLKRSEKKRSMNNEDKDKELDTEVKEEFAEAAELGSGGASELKEKLREYTDRSPKLSGGDIDAAWDEADSGEETVGGSNMTPDQDVVDELGEAYGVTYADDEPLDFEEKIEERDRDRWELDPRSAEKDR